jgi:DNA-binding LacI/PurR family transcriptional regulator
MQARVTLREVAAKAGVHHTTASRALKNDPRICQETMDKVRSVAAAMGYMPDPMLAALNAYRHASRQSTFHGTIGWITNHSTRDGWRRSICYERYYEGAAAELLRHGYRLEEYWLQEDGMTARRSSQILLNRGIRGLLICPLPISRGHLSLKWEQFAAVSFGYSLLRPKLHLFSAAHYRSMITCLRKLRKMGYQRIGMVSAEDMDERMDRLWTAAYRTELPLLPESQDIPISLLKGRSGISDKGFKQQFLKWYRTHKPEAIITPTSPVMEWLLEEGYRIPDEVSVVNASLQLESPLSGLLEASCETGAAAASFLVSMLQRGEYGLPAIPQRVLLEGRWWPGDTLGIPRSASSTPIKKKPPSPLKRRLSKPYV